jgi:hypothetical protein
MIGIDPEVTKMMDRTNPDDLIAFLQSRKFEIDTEHWRISFSHVADYAELCCVWYLVDVWAYIVTFPHEQCDDPACFCSEEFLKHEWDWGDDDDCDD